MPFFGFFFFFCDFARGEFRLRSSTNTKYNETQVYTIYTNSGVKRRKKITGRNESEKSARKSIRLARMCESFLNVLACYKMCVCVFVGWGGGEWKGL